MCYDKLEKLKWEECLVLSSEIFQTASVSGKEVEQEKRIKILVRGMEGKVFLF